MVDLNDFKVNRIIKEDTRAKHLALNLKSILRNEDAVLLLDKMAFNAADPYHELIKGLELVDTNDIYHRFIDSSRGIESKLIYPATENHIRKYSEQGRRLIRETPAMHQSVTRPFFEQLRLNGQIDWIDNILNDESEMERRLIDIKCPKTGFIILPDYKWTDETNLIGLYLLVIPRRKDLWSIRDLTGDHLPLLKSIQSDLKNSIFNNSESARYKYPDGSPVLYEHLRVYFHYPPTYPHLHIHVAMASAQTSCSVGQAILLDDVIENLEKVSSKYYNEMVSLSMDFGETHALYTFLKNQNHQ